MCDIVASEDPLLIVYCPDKYIFQKMSDEVADDSLTTMKHICNWFVTSEINKNLFTALYADENILYFTEDSEKINLVRPLTWHITSEKRIEF